MDEEDGRLGPRARKFGRFDVLTDAIAVSLRQPLRAWFLTGIYSGSSAVNYLQIAYPDDHLNSQPCTAALRFGAEPAQASVLLQVKEKQYENVPGK